MFPLFRKTDVFQSYCLSLGHFYFLAEYFSYFFRCSDDALQNQFWYHDAPFDDILIDIPEPSCVYHFYVPSLCDKYIFCMKKPLSPVFWITGGACIGYFPSLYVANQYEYTEEIYLSEFFCGKIFYFFLRKRNSFYEFLCYIGCFLSFVFGRDRYAISHIFSWQKIMRCWQCLRKLLREFYVESCDEYISEDIEISSESSLELCYFSVLRIIIKALIKIAEISDEKQIFLVLSPCFFFGREKFVRKWTEKFLERLSMYALCTKNKRYIDIPTSFFDNPVRILDSESSRKKSFS